MIILNTQKGKRYQKQARREDGCIMWVDVWGQLWVEEILTPKDSLINIKYDFTL